MVGQRVKATTVYVSGIQLKFSILSVPQNHHICLLLQPMRQKNKSQIWVWYDIDVTCDSSVTFNYEASICLKSIHCLKCKNKKILKKWYLHIFFSFFKKRRKWHLRWFEALACLPVIWKESFYSYMTRVCLKKVK